jgi:hypothetical protein
MGYTLHVHTAGVGGGERDAYCTSKLQAVDRDVLRRLLTVLLLIYDVENLPEKLPEHQIAGKKFVRHQHFSGSQLYQ